MLKRTDSRLPLLLLALTLMVVHFRLLLGEVFFWGLPSLQFYPWREYAFSLIREGQLPLWNPFNGAGAPLFANYQSALLYPFNWIGFFLPLAQTMSITNVLHLFIAGWGMWRLTGAIGANGLGRGVSAFAFGMTNYLVARLGTFPIINSAAWLPWMVWAAYDLLKTGNRRSAAWLALFAALQLLAGHAQTTWYSMGIVGLFALWYSFRIRPIRWLRLIAVAGCIMLGAGVAALQLSATAELLGQSQRSGGVDYWTAMNFSYGPARTLNFLSPIIFGTPADGSYFTQGAYFEDAVYIGLIPLLAALAAVFNWLRRRRTDPLARYVPFLLGIVTVGYVLALGQYSPIFPFLYEYVPTFDLFQAPVRWHLWTVFGLSVLAGIGATWWQRGGQWTIRFTVACIGMALVTLALMPFIGIGNPALGVLVRALLVMSIFGAVAGWLTLRKPDIQSPRYGRWKLFLFVTIAVDLGIASWGLNPTVPVEFYLPDEQAQDQSVRAYLPQAVEQSLKFAQYFRFDDYRVAVDNWRSLRSLNLPNSNLISRFALLNNFDPLLPAGYIEYIHLIESNPLDNRSMLRAASVNEVADQEGVFRSISPDTQRVWTVSSIWWHETQDQLNLAVSDTDWNPFAQAHMLGDRGREPVVETESGEIVMAQYRANDVTIFVDMQRDGWLILADTDYPGWVATIDSEPTQIYRANLMFRAVQVSRGEHMVRFEYRPRWLVPGALLSGASLIVLLMLFRLKNVTTPYNQGDDVMTG